MTRLASKDVIDLPDSCFIGCSNNRIARKQISGEDVLVPGSKSELAVSRLRICASVPSDLNLGPSPTFVFFDEVPIPPKLLPLRSMGGMEQLLTFCELRSN